MKNTRIFKFSALSIMDLKYNNIHTAEAAGSISLNLAPEIMEQKSGPSNYPIEAEVGGYSSEIAINIADYDSDLIDALLGTTKVSNNVASGLITDQENFGSADVVASAGDAIATLALSNTLTDIKSGLYKIVIDDISTGAASLIALSSNDLKVEDYADYDNRIVTSFTITDAAVISLGNGVTATAAASVDLTGFENGDGYVFRVLASGEDSNSISVGNIVERVPHVKLLALSREIENGRWFEILIHRCLLSGVNFNFADTFAQNDITGRAIYDPSMGNLARITDFRRTS